MGLEAGREGSGEYILFCSLLCGLNFYDHIFLQLNRSNVQYKTNTSRSPRVGSLFTSVTHGKKT